MPGFLGVLGEDSSDAEAIRTLYRRLRAEAGLSPIKIRPHGYEGCGQLLRKGHAQLLAWEKVGCTRAVICYDADRDKRTPAELLEAKGKEVAEVVAALRAMRERPREM